MNLIEGIQEQQKRFREVLIPAYESIGPSGVWGLTMVLRPYLERSDRAIASGDVVEMVRVLQEMRTVED